MTAKAGAMRPGRVARQPQPVLSPDSSGPCLDAHIASVQLRNWLQR